jgi:hypothetical protein
MVGFGDLRVAEARAAQAQQTAIVTACENAWDEEFIAGIKNSDNCSGFVKSVAGKVGILLPATANADGLVDEIASKWTKLDSGLIAWREARTGTFVLAGLKSSDHAPARNNGHIVVITDGSLYRDIYPPCWGGSTGSAQSRGDKSVGEVWNRTDRDKVIYRAYR